MKQEMIEVDGVKFLRIPIKTKIITENDDFLNIIKESTKGILQKGDIISISESPQQDSRPLKPGAELISQIFIVFSIK